MIDRLLAAASSKGGVVLIALVALLVLERAFPMARAVGGLRRVWRNLSLAGLNGLLSFLIIVPLSALAAGHGLWARPPWWSGLPGLGLDLVILDLWIYWWHRANHGIAFLWRFHEVHHLDGFLDASSALRFHFGEVLLSSLVRAGVVVALGMPLTSVAVFETLIAVNAIFHHSNVRLPPKLEGALALLLVTPSIHWLHHHALRADTDSNYATLLSAWDRLFGSRSAGRRQPDMAIGVEGAGDETVGRLITRPFRPGS